MTYVELVNRAISAGYRLEYGINVDCLNCKRQAIIFKCNDNEVAACICGFREKIEDKK